jgi:nucleotide-binding universal stress UspA family protein
MSFNLLNFRTIALATDLTDTSSSALRYAQAMARMYQSTLVLIYVADPIAYAFPKGAPPLLEANAAAVAELTRIEAETRALGIPVHSVVESGAICERIRQAVHDCRADLLLLGTHGKTEAGRVALGTVARQLLAKSAVPIMTVSPDALNSLPLVGCWRRVLAATDFSPASIYALHCAHQVALRQLVIIHVAKSAKSAECRECREKLRFLAPFNESHTVPVEHIVTNGGAGKTISEYARKYAVDLVVLGSPENELSEKAFSTSTVLQVISRVNCPVLCLPSLAASVTRKPAQRKEAVVGGRLL